MRVFLDPKIRRDFKWNLLDTFVLLAYMCRNWALTRNAPFMLVLEREGGTFFDTIMPYLAVRLIIRSRSDLLTLIKGPGLDRRTAGADGALSGGDGEESCRHLKDPPEWNLDSESAGLHPATGKRDFRGKCDPFRPLFRGGHAPESRASIEQKVLARPSWRAFARFSCLA